MRKAFLFFLAMHLGLSAFAQEEIERKSFFEYLKNLDFQGASEMTHQVQDSTLSEAMHGLAMLLSESGQRGLSKVDSARFIRLDGLYDNSDYQKITTKLLLGYYYFYTNPYTAKPIENFIQAHELAMKHGVAEEAKFALQSIIEVHHRNLYQLDKKVTYYDSLKSQVTDNLDLPDQFYTYINKSTFELRKTDFQVQLNDGFWKEFDGVMQSFDVSHPFWVQYFINKGVYKKHLAYDELDNNREERGLAYLEEAKSYLHTALERMGKELYWHFYKFRVYIQLSEIARLKGDFQGGLKHVKNAEAYSYGNDPIRAEHYVYLYMAPNYYGMGNFEKAYSSLEKANRLRIDLNAEQNQLKMLQTTLELETLSKEEALRRVRFWLGISLFFIFFISTIYLLIQKNTKKKQLLAIKERDIEKQKTVGLLKEQELLTIDAMIEGQEIERQRIAEDLHDDLGGHMAAIKLHFTSLHKQIKSGSSELYSKTDALIEEAYDKVRAISHAKNSGVIAREGLLRSVKDIADKVSIANNLSISVIDHGLDNRLENNLELMLFRVIQELITNVVKHAEASEVYIHLTNHGDSLNIMIEDNGKGFDTDQLTQKKEGIGLKNIDRRINHLEGTMEIDSKLNTGTTIILNIPL